MLAWLGLGVRLGVRVGIVGGLIAGLIVAVAGSLLTSSLIDLAAFSVNGFMLIPVVVPLMYYRSFFSTPVLVAQYERVSQHLTLITIGAALPAFFIGVVTFMMPVVMMPVLLGRGVTVENSGAWYDQLYTPLLEGWGVVVALATVLGYGVATYLLRARYKP